MRRPCDSLYLRAAVKSPPRCDEDRGWQHSLRKRRCFLQPFQGRRLNLEFQKGNASSFHIMRIILTDLVYFVYLPFCSFLPEGSKQHGQRQTINMDISGEWSVSNSTGPQWGG